jgi:hypothetical protein
VKEVKGEFDRKTPGQRLRATIYVWWQQAGEQGDFETFYLHKMEKIIEGVKSKLEAKE